MVAGAAQLVDDHLRAEVGPELAAVPGPGQRRAGQLAPGSGANPMGRLGLPDDIAEMVAALAGPARWINGQILYVNGGAA